MKLPICKGSKYGRVYRWSGEEDDYLREAYTKEPKEVILGNLDRGWEAISHRARKLGVERFTEEEGHKERAFTCPLREEAGVGLSGQTLYRCPRNDGLFGSGAGTCYLCEEYRKWLGSSTEREI